MSGPARIRRGVSVLLVDDQPIIGESVRRALEDDPAIRFHHCLRADRALAAAARLQPTVILQDLVMPDADGLSLIRYFRANPDTREVPIIVLSTREDAAVKAEAFALGANDYVVKLPDKLELLARIRYHSRGYISLLDSRDAWDALVETQRQLEARNRFIRRTFGRYLSDEVVQSLLETPGGLNIGGEMRRVTILMTDLRGFGAICERLEPRQVVALLNNYLGVMSDIVGRHEGTVDEFIGDAVLAIFGAPILRADDARRAVGCALEMQLGMEIVNERNQAAGLPRVEMGIGLNTGEIVVGNIGSDRRAKYGVVGSHVNLTSRIESYTVGGQILASESTIRDAGDGIRIDGQMEVEPKGMPPTRLYDVGGIGAPYDLFLNRPTEAILDLPEPIPLRFFVVQGKDVSAEAEAGELTSLSSHVGRIRAARQVAPLQNLKLQLANGALGGLEFWAKTIPRPVQQNGGFDVWFTALPDGVRRLVAAHVETAGREIPGREG
jgi:adenylate cyclase